jgi:hypothetical protein
MLAAYEDAYPVSTHSARRIVPMLIELLGPCGSVVDLGGGTGAWCREFKKHGCRVTCIDDRRIRDEELVIDAAEFVGCDLAADMPRPVKADLALSLEFAEHVPQQRASEIVDLLTRCSPAIVFSASLPGQPGYRHVNEQPPNYWKALFRSRGYLCLDLLRPRIIGWADIPYWYRQNMFVYANEDAAAGLRHLATGFEAIPDDFELVHESLLKRYRTAGRAPGLRRWLASLPSAIRTSWQTRRPGAAQDRPPLPARRNG